MKYLSIDLESTGLEQDCLIIEFAAIPFDTERLELADSLSFHNYVQCPSLEQLRPTLSAWVVEHNAQLIQTAHHQGKPLEQFKQEWGHYLASPAVRQYFSTPQYVLFGKSLNAIDLPFLNRDLGPEFMRKYFVHRQLDLSSFVYGLVDMKQLPPATVAGSELMKFLGMGDVAHTALEDAINTARIYFALLQRFGPDPGHSSPLTTNL